MTMRTIGQFSVCIHLHDVRILRVWRKVISALEAIIVVCIKLKTKSKNAEVQYNR